MFSLVLILCSFRSQIHPLLLKKQKRKHLEPELLCGPPTVSAGFVCWLTVGLGLLIAFFRDVILQYVRISCLSLFPANHLWTVGQTEVLCLKKRNNFLSDEILLPILLSFSCPIYCLDLKSVTIFEGFVFKLCSCFSFVTALTDFSDVYFSIG